MPKIIEYIGEPMELADYEEKHRPENQRLVDGIPLDPELRPGFDSTPNDERDRQEVSDWWGRPFIVSTTWEQMARPNQTQAEMEQQKKQWFESWESGTRYDARCLDGGAWDRSTWHGSFGSLKEAIRYVREKFSHQVDPLR